MENKYRSFRTAFLLLITLCSAGALSAQSILLQHATLIDGNGKTPRPNTDLLIQGDTIASIGPGLPIKGARVIDLRGKTIMPALITTHAHVGTLKGTTTDGTNYTRDNLLRQLKKYNNYGVSTVLAMGTDRPLIFAGFRDSSRAGLLPGARLFSAGYGFGVPGAAPPSSFGMDQVFRPANAAEARDQVESLLPLQPAVLKIWVDDFNGKFPKMSPEIYGAIITRAHELHLRVASHLYYLEDAKRLVDKGIDIIAHSIRDKDIDDTLLAAMKARGVAYIPTLSLDEFAYIYARRPDWIDDPFFRASLEPGVYEMITAKDYQEKLKASPDYERNKTGFEIALRNLKKIYDAGILVSLGTDSGATPLRAQGFSEHLELELMVQAGLTPLEAITVATKNASVLLQIDSRFGTIEKGKVADLLVLSADPTKDIRNTRKIESVWKAGKQISKGPLSK
jgi:imidazolonepropionase-like amidohydrolase